MTLSIVDATEALEAAGRAAKGESGGLDLSSASAGSLRANNEELTASIRQIENAMRAAEGQINSYDSAIERDQALHLISQAIQSDEIDLMLDATDHLEGLTGAMRETVEARLLSAITTAQATAAEEARTLALERGSKATQDAGDIEDKQAEARSKMTRMLAEATGEAAVINLDYADAIREVGRVIQEAGAGEEEAALLIAAATEKRRVALEELAEAEDQYLQTKSTHTPAVVALELDAAAAAQKARDNRTADLFMALQDETITEEQFREQSLKAEEKYQDQLTALRQAKAQEVLGSAKMVSDTMMNLVDSQIDAINQKLDQEESDALERADGNLEEQAKIREEYENKRKREMARVFKIQKGLEIANVAISAASASVAALGPPPTGLGPVLGPALIPFILGAAGVQTGMILSQNPSFHEGGVVRGMGDQPITAQGGEVFLNRSAVAALGGAEAADGLNAGGGAGGAVVVQMTYKQQVFDQVVIDNIAKGGPLRSALNRAQRQGRRGRIGGRL